LCNPYVLALPRTTSTDAPRNPSKLAPSQQKDQKNQTNPEKRKKSLLDPGRHFPVPFLTPIYSVFLHLIQNRHAQHPFDLKLPQDAHQALLIGRLWVPDIGAVVCAVTPDAVFDLLQLAPTSSQLLELPEVAQQVRAFVSASDLPSRATALAAGALSRSSKLIIIKKIVWF
jgi:hypothetical protein